MKKLAFLFFVMISFNCFAESVGEGVIYVTNFEKKFSDWKIKEFRGKANFEIGKSSKQMITLLSDHNSFGLSKDLYMDISKYQYLNIEWMVENFPLNGDARDKSKDDQAAQVYVLVPSFPEMINYKAIGYVWDNNAPLGKYPSKKSKNVKYVVLRNKKDSSGKWVYDKVNVYKDFKDMWGIDLQKRKILVSINIDSDDTQSTAKSSFGNIFFSPR